MIVAEDLHFAWESSRPVLRGLSCAIGDGEHLCILGRNGSGKSSLVRLLNGLEVADSGRVLVDGLDTRDESSLPAIRASLQVVFQEPFSQQVGLTLGEDVRFGLANIGLAREEMAGRVGWALALAGLQVEEGRAVSTLSGGEAQKLALASVLALRPRHLVLDEATSMLDPGSRRAFRASLSEARAELGFSLVEITHRAEEVLEADRWLLLDGGRVAAEGRPRDLCAVPGLLESCGIARPFVAAYQAALGITS